MKKFYFLLTALLLSGSAISQTTNPAPYCNSQAQFNYNMWNYIKVAGTNHSFGAMGSFGNANTYTYYNNVVFPSVAAGATMTIEVRPYAPNDGEPVYFGVYIDFNNNNTFDADELVMKNNNTTNTPLPVFGAATAAITKTITIPSTAAAGKHRMRLVRAGNTNNPYGNYDNNYNIPACINVNQFNYGSIYDFDITVTNNLSVTDVTDQQEGSLEIYPNPVKNYLNISNPKKYEIRKISVYSASGQIVIQEDVKAQDNKGIDVSALDKGVYYIDVETSGTRYTNKFLKE